MQKCKVDYELCTQPGSHHEKEGKENEDSAIILSTGNNRVFSVLSDGCGSSMYGKKTSECTVETVMRFFLNNKTDVFDQDNQIELRRLIFDIQENLSKEADKYKTNLSEMMGTLIVLGIDLKARRFFIIHVGDGLVARKNRNEEWKIASLPENGVTDQYTYFCNSPDIFRRRHFRVKYGYFTDNHDFFVCSDGYYTGCRTSKQYIKKISDGVPENVDDATYCKISVDNV